MLSVIDEEASLSIQNAYSEGYRRGLLEYQPECERLNVLLANYMTELKEEQSAHNALRNAVPLWVGGGVLVGVFVTLIAGGLF